jgi:hypothetical protein
VKPVASRIYYTEAYDVQALGEKYFRFHIVTQPHLFPAEFGIPDRGVVCTHRMEEGGFAAWQRKENPFRQISPPP